MGPSGPQYRLCGAVVVSSLVCLRGRPFRAPTGVAAGYIDRSGAAIFLPLFLEASARPRDEPDEHRNPEKGLTKQPKIHFLDPDVRRAILRRCGEVGGAEVASAIVAEVLKQIRTERLPLDAFPVRTTDGREDGVRPLPPRDHVPEQPQNGDALGHHHDPQTPRRARWALRRPGNAYHLQSGIDPVQRVAGTAQGGQRTDCGRGHVGPGRRRGRLRSPGGLGPRTWRGSTRGR